MIVPIVAAGAFAVLFHYKHFPFAEISNPDRHTIYQVALQISATLGGLTFTSVSVLVNLLRTPLAAIDKVLPPDAKRAIGNAFLDCLIATAAVFFSALIGFISDTPTPNPYVEAAFCMCCIFALLRYYRIVAILRLLLPTAS